MRHFNCIIILLLSSIGGALHAQVTQEWARRYNGPANGADYVNALALGPGGTIYVTGGSHGIGTGIDFATIKYSSSGDSLWAARYNGTGNGDDVSNSICVDPAGCVYVTGSSLGSAGNLDYVTIKYDQSGHTVWTARYNGPGNDMDESVSVAVDDSENVYVTGTSVGSGTADDICTIKYSSVGDQLWVRRFSGPLNTYDDADALTIDRSGFVYVLGFSASSYIVIKYNPGGDTVWTARYGGAGGGNASLTVDRTGNAYVAGISTFGTLNYDYVTIKYNSAGVQQWASRYSGTSNGDDLSQGIAADDSGNVYVTGYSQNSSLNTDYLTIKYNSNGDSVWVRGYNGPGSLSDYALGIALDSYSNVYVTGYVTGSSSGNDFATIKYNSSGEQKWVVRYNGPQSNAFDEAKCITVDHSGNVYVAGRSFVATDDMTLVKYSQTPQSVESVPSLCGYMTLCQNFPNPFNPSTTIRYELRHGSFITLKVYNTLGQEVATLVNETKPAGVYTVEFDARSLASGIYFYRIQAGNFVDTKKLILLR